jgi:hypothetical protein
LGSETPVGGFHAATAMGNMGASGNGFTKYNAIQNDTTADWTDDDEGIVDGNTDGYSYVGEHAPRTQRTKEPIAAPHRYCLWLCCLLLFPLLLLPFLGPAWLSNTVPPPRMMMDTQPCDLLPIGHSGRVKLCCDCDTPGRLEDAVQAASSSPGSTSSNPALVKEAVLIAGLSTGSTSSEPALVKDVVHNARVPTSSTSSKPADPTRKKPSEWPALFCIAHMMPHGPELALMKSHFTRGVGIFACNDQAVFCSGGRIALGGTGDSTFHTLPVPNIKMSKGNVAIPGQTTNSWLNTKLFTKVFEAMLHGRFWAYDWVIKVDPDAVFFPDRLREHVAPLTVRAGPDADAVYIRNCPKNPYIHLMGAIEVFFERSHANVL